MNIIRCMPKAFLKWCKKNAHTAVSLELLTAYIAEKLGSDALDTEKLLSVSAVSTWIKKNGIGKLSAESFIDYINESLFGERKKQKSFDYTDSKNFRRLKEIKDLWNWCKENGQKWVTIDALLRGTRSLTPQRIMAMKAIFPPEDWFTEG